ncbi:uncharacterized protein F4822DRAFT_412074 [Hypoxylon trugodes]|uniref:uncharacterized protein n=1 Tax=Hypoxylon trugodes TaxID=326681 RepID=UPI00219E658E|nr:uncharacterized protein F4822DRAFT_412074 [Hypoxylon trugodes]KAI1387096.1 hypothetical protein F4822DRAFT_412074 [Hypoxylon trugodes]
MDRTLPNWSIPPATEYGNNNVGDLTELPNDLFVLISSYLSPQDCILCRRVNRRWLTAFTNVDISRNFMRWHFPRSREARGAADELTNNPDWACVFARVARRYYYLRSAKPRLVEKVNIVQETGSFKGLFCGVAPWNRWLRWNENTAVFQHRDPTWCSDNGLLVYQEAISGSCVAYDLETRHRFPVPFDVSDKTVRRLRLACEVLVIEWCEREPYHQLNDQEGVHRHFATAFDLQRPTPSSPEFHVTWDIKHRSEWKIHFLGLPLNNHDRFFSVHTSTHYALYLWQPNRSPWGEEDPLEQLTVWNISKPSSYRPSLDPSGVGKPESGSSEEGPYVINRFTWRDLEYLGLRQRHTPSLREILLDDTNIYVHEEEHRWLVGQHSSLSPPRHHLVRCTGFPFFGSGPRWVDECCADGNIHMSFCPRAGSLSRVLRVDWPTGLASAPCWRHEEFPYLTVSDIIDGGAGVRVVARQCFMMEALSSFVLPKISVQEQSEDDGEEELSEVRFTDEMWWELLGKGKIAGDERWVIGEDGGGKVTIVRF